MKRTIAFIFLLALLAGFVARSFGDAPGFSDRLALGSQPSFLAGVNYPFKSAEDFGTGSWGYSGVAEPTTYQEIDTDFANLAASGARVVKWRIFNDGRYSPDFNADGVTTGLDDHVFTDVDAALALAKKHDLYLVFSLFASGFWTTDCVQRSVHLGGHADSLTDPVRRQLLIDQAIVPLLRHIGANPRVLGYEIIAEPEWGVSELNHDQDGRIKVPLASVQSFVTQVAAAIHYYSPALVTVESNRASNMAYWRGTGVDYFSFSWYDWLQPWEPLDRPASTFHLDRPIVLGEFPSIGSYYQLSQIYDLALRQHYAGAFTWSYGNNDQYSNWSQVDDEFLRWMTDHAAIIAAGARSPIPVSPVQLQQPPYQVQNVRVVEGNDGSWLQADVGVPLPGTYHLQWFIYDATTNPSTPAQDQTIAFSNLVQRLVVQVTSLAQGRTYKASLGIFDQNYHLVKWFDGLAVLKLQGGAPQLQTQVVEDPCGQEKAPGTT